MSNGTFLKVPTLAGNVAHEGDGFTVASHVARRGSSVPFLTSVISDISTQVTVISLSVFWDVADHCLDRWHLPDFTGDETSN